MKRQTEAFNYSEYYLGQQGQDYFIWQNQGNLQRGRINARKFQPYVRSDDTVLDFGCGSGALLYHLVCGHRIGVEINPAARTMARQSGIEIHTTLETVADQSIDVAISNHVLEHVLCPLEALRQLHSKLVSKGRLVLCVPIDDWRTQKQVDFSDVNHHLYTWTPLLMGNLLTEANFSIERVWIYTHAWPPAHWQMLDAHLPVWLFDLICNFTARRYKRRQLMALAKK